MRRSLITLIAATAAAVTIGLAPTASSAGDTIHTPIQRGPGDLTAVPCTTYYKTVTLAITDFGMTANGAAAPKCIRISSSGTLKIVNNATGDATVTFAGDTNEMVMGELWNMAPVGDYYAAGSTLGFSVDELALSAMTIKVF